MNLNQLQYNSLAENTFADRLKKAKLMAGYTQSSLSKKVGLSLSTVNELEAGYRNVLYRDTLLKLLTVLDKNILCDDYCNFILNQEYEITSLIDKYGIKKLSQILSVHRSTIERWKHCQNQVNRKYYGLIKKLTGVTQ